MIQHMVRTHGLDPARVFITGPSAGGAMTSVLLAVYLETFAAGAVVAGLPFGLAGNVQEAFAAMRGGLQLGGQELGPWSPEPRPRRGASRVLRSGMARQTRRSSSTTLAASPANGRLHGLAEQPDEIRARRDWTRSVWRAARSGSGRGRHGRRRCAAR